MQDFPQRHYKVWTIDGVGARTFGIPLDSLGAKPTHLACNADGVFINYSGGELRVPPRQSQAIRLHAPFWLSSAAGIPLASLGRHPGEEWWFATSAGGGYLNELPLARTSYVAIGRTRAYIGVVDSFAIHVLALSGAAVGVIQEPIRVPFTTADDIERRNGECASGDGNCVNITAITTRI